MTAVLCLIRRIDLGQLAGGLVGRFDMALVEGVEQTAEDLAAEQALNSLADRAQIDLSMATISSVQRGPAWTPHDIASQWQRVKTNGWEAAFGEAAQTYNFDLSLLLGIASRESNIREELGDGGHGHGIMQIDDRSFPQFTGSNDWKDARLNLLKGAEVLRESYQVIENGNGKRLIYRDRKGISHEYIGATLTESGLIQTAVAAYNCGGAAYYFMSKDKNPDAATTGRDYSQDTLNRANSFSNIIRPVG